jgi:hypothetical protein
MHELSETEYKLVLPIYESITDNRAHVFGVIEGNNPGRVFVDDKQSPTAALIATGWCFLGGNAANDGFNSALKTLLEADIMPNVEDGHVLIYSFSDAWKDVLDELLGEYGVRRVDRTVLDLDPALFKQRYTDWRQQIPEAYRVQRIDCALAESVAETLNTWAGIDHFLSGGYGFCVLNGDKIVSKCQTVYVGGGFAETAISTEEPYRRQRLGTLAACAYIEHGLAQGVLAEWGCFYNKASGFMAEKLGFVNRRDVKLNYVKMD